uniref:Putative polypyrimidine tract-binding protein puf60 rrm superfamily n=1 Tax=Xenopsylla cheopis TaxID=163159 RepID=A0A6M2DZ66_XENCH
MMPTAAAVAAAAATAKIQAMDAVASNAVALGLSNLSSSPTIPLSVPTIAACVPPIATVTPTAPVAISAAVKLPGVVIPPPGVVVPQVIQPPGVVTPTSQPVIIPVSVLPNSEVSTTMVSTNSPATTASQTMTTQNNEARMAQERQQEELQKKLLDETEPQTLQQQESMCIKGQSARHLVMQRLMRKVDTNVIILRNMVGPEEVDETLQEEIQEECGKFGEVKSVIIYKESQSEAVDTDILVKIFVEFSCMMEAETARDALNGRYFGGRLVSAQLYEQALFDHGDFSA